MNKQEKMMAILLGLCLVGWLWYSVDEQKKAAEAAREAMAEEAQRAAEAPNRNGEDVAVTNVPAVVSKPETVAESLSPAKKFSYQRPEQLVTLSNAQEVVTFTTHGAAVKGVTLLDYARDCGKISAENPPVALDFADAPALAADMDFEIAEQGGDYVLFRSAAMTRRALPSTIISRRSRRGNPSPGNMPTSTGARCPPA